MVGLLVAGSSLLGYVVAALVNASAWCPRWHDIYQRKMYDPSAPIRMQDGTWHVFPDGCSGWCHYSSPDLFHWSQHPPLGVGGLTGSVSFTSSRDGVLLLHPKGGNYIARAVPNNSSLDSFRDTGEVATAPPGNWCVGVVCECAGAGCLPGSC